MVVVAAAEVVSVCRADQKLGSNAVVSFRLTEELIEALDAQHVPAELLGHLAAREERAYGRPHESNEDDNTALPTAARQMSVRFLARLVHVFAPSTGDWFASVALLDALSVQAPNGLNVEELPALCAAIVKMVKKIDSVEMRCFYTSMTPKVAQAASHLAQGLETLGYTTVPVNAEELQKQEDWLLRTLQWRINLPSHESWLNIFCIRLNVLTSSILQPSIQWIKEQSTFVASALVMWQATTARLTPRRMVAGILSINIGRARLVPFEAFKPDNISSSQWEQLLADTQLEGPTAQCMLNDGHAHYMLKALEAALDCTMEELQADAALVLSDVCSMRSEERARAGQ